MRLILIVMIAVVSGLGILFVLKLNEFSQSIGHDRPYTVAFNSPRHDRSPAPFHTRPIEGLISLGAPLADIDAGKYPNFLSEIIFRENKIYRWRKFNLTYYIDAGTRRRLNETKVLRAFNQWQQKSRLFSFQPTTDPRLADITISLSSTSEKQRMGEAGPDMIDLGNVYQINDKTVQEYVIRHAQVVLSDEHFGFDQVEAYNQSGRDHGFQTLVHELGHVLGISGHSPLEGDCMYFQAHFSGQACDNITPDVNTLQLLYGRSDLLVRDLYQSRRSIR